MDQVQAALAESSKTILSMQDRLCQAAAQVAALKASMSNETLTGSLVFDSCKAIDGASTMIAVKSGKFVELNPLLKGIAGGGMSWLPFVAVMGALVLAYNWADNAGYIGTKTAVGVNGITCAVAGRNLWLMLK